MGGVYRPSKGKAPRHCKACHTILRADDKGRLCPQSGCGWRWSRRKGWNGPPKVRLQRKPFVAMETTPSQKLRCPQHGLQLERKYDHLRNRLLETCPLDYCPHNVTVEPTKVPDGHTWEHPSVA